MSSEETCLQGFPNDDIFEVISFAFANESQTLSLLAHNHGESNALAWESSEAKYKILRNSHEVRISLRHSRNITCRKANITAPAAQYHS